MGDDLWLVTLQKKTDVPIVVYVEALQISCENAWLPCSAAIGDIFPFVNRQN